MKSFVDERVKSRRNRDGDDLSSEGTGSESSFNCLYDKSFGGDEDYVPSPIEVGGNMPEGGHFEDENLGASIPIVRHANDNRVQDTSKRSVSNQGNRNAGGDISLKYNPTENQSSVAKGTGQTTEGINSEELQKIEDVAQPIPHRTKRSFPGFKKLSAFLGKKKQVSPCLATSEETSTKKIDEVEDNDRDQIHDIEKTIEDNAQPYSDSVIIRVEETVPTNNYEVTRPMNSNEVTRPTNNYEVNGSMNNNEVTVKTSQEENSSLGRRGLFRLRTRSLKTPDDITVSSKKSFSSRLSALSETSRRSLSSKPRLSFLRRKSEVNDDDSSLDSDMNAVSKRKFSLCFYVRIIS
jgi:hypothetical protein